MRASRRIEARMRVGHPRKGFGVPRVRFAEWSRSEKSSGDGKCGEGGVLCGWKVSAGAAVAAVRPVLAQGRKERGMNKFALEQDEPARHARALQAEMLAGSRKLARCQFDPGFQKGGPGLDLLA